MEDDRPTASQVDQEEEAEDAVPDWSQFAAFKRANTDKDASGTPFGSGRSTLVPFIPKRGEKDFEPLAPNASLPAGSKEATLSTHQQHLLSSSRHALYTALSSGSRHHSSRAHNSFTWRPEIGRASCDSEDGLAAHGIHFGNVGHFHVGRKRLELLPEEALYMVERGAVELWREYEGEEGAEGAQAAKRRVPMSVQQAWDECLGQYDLTPERYQVYAFLRRLGYIVTRALPIPGTSRPVWTPPPPPLYLRLLHLLTHPLFALRDSLVRAVSEVQVRARRAIEARKNEDAKGQKVVKRIQWAETRRPGKSEGRYESLVAGARWTSYDQIFSRLQIIPTCAPHTPSRPLRAPLPHTPSPLTPLRPKPADQTVGLEGTEGNWAEYPYQTFYHVYKPATKYKKNNPPPPDFRLVIVNAATTPLPTLFELSSLFATLPLPDNYDESIDPLGPSALAPHNARKQLPPRPAAQPAAPAADQPAPTRLQSLFSTLPSALTRILPSALLPPPPPASAAGGPGGGKKPRPPPGPKAPSPYPFLKTGRRTVLLAVVDNGTASIMRMSEGEFGKVPWVGGRRKD
ncbi:hypothetical protein JCM6882_006249 [Rhodosporidiobolus microsporus]